jgi:hypothetical protein
MNKYLSIALGSALAWGIGVSHAAEPLALTETEMDTVTAGVGFTSITLVQKLVDIEEAIVEVKAGVFQVDTLVSGFSAVAEAEADAQGPNADAQTFSFAEITPVDTTGFFKANSLSKSIALVSP